jgi:hypothetical protein
MNISSRPNNFPRPKPNPATESDIPQKAGRVIGIE